MTPLLAVKRIACALGLGQYFIEFCEVCGRRTEAVWWAPDELWMPIVGRYGGVRCVKCFTTEWYRRGTILRWRPEVAHRRNAWGQWP